MIDTAAVLGYANPVRPSLGGYGCGSPLDQGAEAMRRKSRGFFHAYRSMAGGVLGSRKACRFLDPVFHHDTSSVARGVEAPVDGNPSVKELPMNTKNAPVAFQISHVAIRQDDQGRYCLNDLHKAAGNEKRHAPNEWLRTQQAKELIAEFELEPGIPGSKNEAGIPAIKTLRGRGIQGTYVVKELVYAYAMWISAKFHLQVIRAYDALQHTQPATPALPRPDTVRLSGDHYAGGGIRIEGDKAWLTFGIKTDELLFNLRQIGYELINRNELPQRLGEIYPEHRLISRDEFQLFQLMREIFTVNEGGKPC